MPQTLLSTPLILLSTLFCNVVWIMVGGVSVHSFCQQGGIFALGVNRQSNMGQCLWLMWGKLSWKPFKPHCSAIVVVLCRFYAKKPLSLARSLAHLINRESRGEKELELWTKIIPQHALFHMLHMVIRLKGSGFQKYCLIYWAYS